MFFPLTILITFAVDDFSSIDASSHDCCILGEKKMLLSKKKINITESNLNKTMSIFNKWINTILWQDQVVQVLTELSRHFHLQKSHSFTSLLLLQGLGGVCFLQNICTVKITSLTFPSPSPLMYRKAVVCQQGSVNVGCWQLHWEALIISSFRLRWNYQLSLLGEALAVATLHIHIVYIL